MFCPYCGAAVPEGTEVCPVCKNVLPPEGAPTSRLVPPPGPGGYGPPGPPGPSVTNPYAGPPGGYPPPAPYPPPSGYAPPPAYPVPPASPYAPPPAYPVPPP